MNRPIGQQMKLKSFFARNERRFTVLAFIAGFVADNLTLRRVDLWIENIIFIIYFFVSAGAIFLFNAYESGRLANTFIRRHIRWVPLVMQFAFGALFSGFFVFYSRSGSFAASWPFLIFLLGLLIGNELFRKRYARTVFQLSIFFIIVFSYAIFIVPVVLGKMNAYTFLLSGFLAAAAFGFVLTGLSKVSPERYRLSRRAIFQSAAVIYLVFNVFYFANIIPPIPLALKDIGVYHLVQKNQDSYLVKYEPVHWYEVFKKVQPIYHRFQNEPVYVFSAVFAPTKLTVPIWHRWSYYDEAQKQWIESSRIRFTISGGRDGGYRGYSLKSNVAPGKWRVDVITERDQIIGRLTFEIQATNAPANQETEIL